MTSGTTRSEVKGRHFHPTLAVYDRSMTRNFAQRFMQGHGPMRMGILFPTETVLANSSLAHYLALAVEAFGTAESRYFMSPQGGGPAGLCEALSDAQQRGEPFALLGASYSFVHLIDELKQRGLSFRLPAGSRVLDTGGYKGQSRELPLDTFYAAAVRAARHRAIELHQHVWHDRAEHAVLRRRQCVGTLGQVRAALDPLSPGRPPHRP